MPVGQMFYCEWILILETCVNWVYFIVKIWKKTIAIFLAQFFSLVKNVERRPLGKEDKKWKMEFFFLLPKNIDGIGDIQWEYINYTLNLLLSLLQNFKCRYYIRQKLD